MTNKNISLITGANGKTGSRVAARLTKLRHPVRLAGRTHPAEWEGKDYVYFDWYDESTHTKALINVDRVYLVVPVLDINPAKVMIPFIEQALRVGVKRFVLLGSASVPENGPIFGPVHQALSRLAPEWAVLQPSYFMENFTEGQHVSTIKNTGTIYSATGNGRVGFVSADDIAEVGVRALIDDKPHNTAHIITGPQSLTYGEVGDIVGKVTGQAIQHISLSDEELKAGMVRAGMPEDYADMLAGLDRRIRENRSEDQVTDIVERVTGRRPISFEQFVQTHADTWK
ncbi:NmrA family NAD(P)-binding protein [Paenibacillus sp. TY11]|uniref:NmrA family NAD(P)-binding protein n=1 Tax=Paenibacillus sp. TY11 TaxID=3448633 RepID=UPI0040396275